MLHAPSESLWDVYDVAKLLCVHKDTVYKWTREGVLPAIHLPKGWIRYDPNDVRQFLKDRTSGKL